MGIIFPISELFLLAAEEDGVMLDITTTCLGTVGHRVSTAKIVAKQPGVYFGNQVLDVLEKETSIRVHKSVEDATRVDVGQSIATLSGPLSQLLSWERVVLNFLQHGSGVATQTQRLVDALNDPKIQVLDTRKTTPLLRIFERAAVVAGGGANHRWGLSDMILIKDNHVDAMRQAGQAISNWLIAIRESNPGTRIAIEIRSPDDIDEIPPGAVDIVLIDNFKISDIVPTVAKIHSQIPGVKIEVSGNITVDTIYQYRGLPIDRISIGSMTHSAPILDLSMKLVASSSPASTVGAA